MDVRTQTDEVKSEKVDDAVIIEKVEDPVVDKATIVLSYMQIELT